MTDARKVSMRVAVPRALLDAKQAASPKREDKWDALVERASKNLANFVR